MSPARAGQSADPAGCVGVGGSHTVRLSRGTDSLPTSCLRAAGCHADRFSAGRNCRALPIAWKPGVHPSRAGIRTPDSSLGTGTDSLVFQPDGPVPLWSVFRFRWWSRSCAGRVPAEVTDLVWGRAFGGLNGQGRTARRRSSRPESPNKIGHKTVSAALVVSLVRRFGRRSRRGSSHQPGGLSSKESTHLPGQAGIVRSWTPRANQVMSFFCVAAQPPKKKMAVHTRKMSPLSHQSNAPSAPATPRNT